MRDEKEERKKQARSNKQTRQSNTAHPRQSLFLEKMSCLGWDSNPRHSTCTYYNLHVHIVYTIMYVHVHVYVYIHVHVHGDSPHAGVMGVGKEKALQFIRACKSHTPSRDALDCFQQWRKGSVCEGTDTLSLDMFICLCIPACAHYMHVYMLNCRGS